MTEAEDIEEIEYQAAKAQAEEAEKRRKEFAVRKEAPVTNIPSAVAMVNLPKDVDDVKELAKIATPYAIQTLLNIALNEDAPPAARVSAATVLLDRGHGRATQGVEISGKLTLGQLIEQSYKLIDEKKAIDVEEESVI